MTILLSEEFKKQLTCSAENTKKYITFTVQDKFKLQATEFQMEG